jgi:hypothetical protein
VLSAHRSDKLLCTRRNPCPARSRYPLTPALLRHGLATKNQTITPDNLESYRELALGRIDVSDFGDGWLPEIAISVHL